MSRRPDLGYDPYPAQVSVDNALLDRLLACAHPADSDLVAAGRLLMRYGNEDPESPIHRVLGLWGLSAAQLCERTRAIWQAGYRPSLDCAEVGSGSDVENAST